MNLKDEISKELWNSIKANYIKENYTGAIQDSIYYLTEQIREKSNLTTDGVSLVSQAFGGKSPRIKINKFQTDSEKNIQLGVVSLLNGLFRAIRNPRSHNKIIDSEVESNKTIIFIDLMLNFVESSKSSFSVESTIGRILDEDFVQNDKYSQLILDEIPDNKIFDVIIESIRNAKKLSDIKSRKIFFNEAFKRLSKIHKSELVSIMSDTLKTTDDIDNMKISLMIMNENWHELEEVVRLRIENKILKSIDNAKIEYYEYEYHLDRHANFAIWIEEIMHSKLLLREELINSLIFKFSKTDINQLVFAIRIASHILNKFLITIPDVCIEKLKNHLNNGNIYIKRQVKHLPSNWQDLLSAEIDNFQEVEEELPF